MAPYEETLFIAAVLGCAAFVLWLAFRFAGDRARERERRGRLVETQIERFAEARDFIEFARSEAGLTWLRADSGELRVKRGLLVLVGTGILFLALGAAMLINAARLTSAVDPAALSDRADAEWWGTVLIALGAGAVLASALLARIARAWGLMPPLRSGDRDARDE